MSISDRVYPYEYENRPATAAPSLPQGYLSVSEVERLAKAGVSISYDAIRERIYSDIPAEGPLNETERMIRAFQDRWSLAHAPHADCYNHSSIVALMPVRHGGKVYVMVQMLGLPPVMLEDDAMMYPSDALIAKIILYKETQKNTEDFGSGTGANATPTSTNGRLTR
jgi:hypothetical protein